MESRHVVKTPEGPAPVGIYSQAVTYERLVYCSGQLPLDPATGHLTTGDITEQAYRCLANLDAICRAAGTALRNAVHIRVYLTDLSDLAGVNVAYSEFFDADPPARTSIGVAELPMNAPVEIDAIVAVP